MKYYFFAVILVCSLMFPLMVSSQQVSKISFLVTKENPQNDSSDRIPAENNFRSPSSFSQKTTSKDTYWVRLELDNPINSVNENDVLYLKMNTFDYGDLYYYDKNQISKKPIGYFDSNSISEKIPFENYYSEIKINSSNLIDGRFLYLKVRRITFNESIQNWNFSLSSTPSEENYNIRDLIRLIPYFIFAGLCFFVWVSTLSFFFYLRKYEFLFYSTYIIFLFFLCSG